MGVEERVAALEREVRNNYREIVKRLDNGDIRFDRVDKALQSIDTSLAAHMAVNGYKDQIIMESRSRSFARFQLKCSFWQQLVLVLIAAASGALFSYLLQRLGT